LCHDRLRHFLDFSKDSDYAAFRGLDAV